MPWVSAAQRRWGNSPAGHKALGDAGVNEWNAASKGQDPPERVGMANKEVNLGKKGSFKVKEGSLHDMLHIPRNEKIGEARMEKAEHSSSPLLRRKARSGIGLSHMKHGG